MHPDRENESGTSPNLTLPLARPAPPIRRRVWIRPHRPHRPRCGPRQRFSKRLPWRTLGRSGSRRRWLFPLSPRPKVGVARNKRHQGGDSYFGGDEAVNQHANAQHETHLVENRRRRDEERAKGEEHDDASRRDDCARLQGEGACGLVRLSRAGEAGRRQPARGKRPPPPWAACHTANSPSRSP